MDYQVILAQLRSDREQLDSAISAFELLAGEPSKMKMRELRGKRKWSAASRANLSKAMKRMWRERQAPKQAATPAPTPAPKKKRHMSKAGRLAISQAVKRMWAEKKKAA